MSPEIVLRNYFHAKDENRPQLLTRVFEPSAELVVVSGTSTISFPARTVGREAITDVLVRDFARTYENIYSFYLQRPMAKAEAFSCHWLVVMSDKDSKSARMGCGRYDWLFSKLAPHLATHLTITIDAMKVLPPAELSHVLSWVRGLDYPWSTAEQVARLAPRNEPLTPVPRHLATYDSGV